MSREGTAESSMDNHPRSVMKISNYLQDFRIKVNHIVKTDKKSRRPTTSKETPLVNLRAINFIINVINMFDGLLTPN